MSDHAADTGDRVAEGAFPRDDLAATSRAMGEDPAPPIADRLDRAFDDALFLLERATSSQRRRAEEPESPSNLYVGTCSDEAIGVRAIAQTIEALGIEKIVSPPHAAPGENVNERGEVEDVDLMEVRQAAEETGLTPEQAEAVAGRIVERESERAMMQGRA
jgi:hypothetical protein